MKLTGSLPGEQVAKGISANATVMAVNPVRSFQLELKEKIGEGGEGSIFSTNVYGQVAKIYHRDRLTTDRRDKLKLMITRQLQYPGICFPQALLLNEADEFIGYSMPEAHGIELATSVFIPKLLFKQFPTWTRFETVELCISILRRVNYLHERNVIIGDVNPGNTLISSPSEIYLVDCDSYQVADHVCPVGFPQFTPPEALGKDFKTILRTPEMENFSVAVLLFMIMMLGRSPYSTKDDTPIVKNIAQGNFPYPSPESNAETPEEQLVPIGPWLSMWETLPEILRLAFFHTFSSKGKHHDPAHRLSDVAWLRLFEQYSAEAPAIVARNPIAMELLAGSTLPKTEPVANFDSNPKTAPASKSQTTSQKTSTSTARPAGIRGVPPAPPPPRPRRRLKPPHQHSKPSLSGGPPPRRKPPHRS